MVAVIPACGEIDTVSVMSDLNILTSEIATHAP